MVRAVLFDYGLTLVSFSYPRRELLGVLQAVRPWLGTLAPDPETLMRTVLEPLEDDLAGLGEDEVDYMAFYESAWRRAGLEVPRETLWQILDLEQLCWDRALRLAEDALPTLEALRARGLKTAIASNAPFPPPMMHRQLRHHGLAELLDAAVFSSEVGRRKPAPELYLAASERLRVPAGEALYVGDRALEDFEGPRRVGMRAILSRELATSQPPPGVPSVARLADLLDLPELGGPAA